MAGNIEECEYGTVDTAALHVQPFQFLSLAGTSSLRERPMLATENMKMFTIVTEMIPVIRKSTQLLIMTGRFYISQCLFYLVAYTDYIML